MHFLYRMLGPNFSDYRLLLVVLIYSTVVESTRKIYMITLLSSDLPISIDLSAKLGPFTVASSPIL